MANSKTPKKTNPYNGKSVVDLEKDLIKLETEYQQSLARGKMAADITPELRQRRARLLTALNQASN
jgi:hypothetical protein